MKRYTVTRDGDLDLTFTGRLVGSGEHGSGGTSGYACDWNRGTKVCLYLTAAGHVVTAVHYWSQWQGESESDIAAVHAGGAEALAWLVDQDGGELGPASKEAWTQAAEAEPEVFQGAEEVS